MNFPSFVWRSALAARAGFIATINLLGAVVTIALAASAVAVAAVVGWLAAVLPAVICVVVLGFLMYGAYWLCVGEREGSARAGADLAESGKEIDRLQGVIAELRNPSRPPEPAAQRARVEARRRSDIKIGSFTHVGGNQTISADNSVMDIGKLTSMTEEAWRVAHPEYNGMPPDAVPEKEDDPDEA